MKNFRFNKITQKIIVYTFLIVGLLYTSCTKDDEEASSDATSIELVSGDNQTADAGATLENPIEVKVEDQFGHAFAETVVHFTPTDGSVSSPTVKTDARGIASVLWSVGGNSGEQSLSVTAFKTDGTTPLKGSPFIVTANAEGEAISESLTLASGGSQTGQVEAVLTNPIIVIVKDTNGNPFAGATVNFATTDGSVSAVSGVSDANGNVSVNWTLGATVGTQTLTITGFKADGTTPLTGSPLTITATGTSVPAFADILQKVSGDGQTGTVSTTLANPIVVRVLDQFENPFAGVTVNFTTTDGSVSAASGVSDANGNVSVNWTLGATVGTQKLTVTGFKADGTTPLTGSPLTVTATGTSVPAFADILQKVSGDSQSGTVNTVLENPIVVRVLDQFENPFAGATVNFATTDGSVSTASGISDVNGNVSVNWTLGLNTGTQTMTVTGFKSDGTTPLSGSPLTITADAQASIGADILQKVSGDNQSGTVSTTLANPIVVRVLDQFENPFAGVTVNFTTTDGSVSAASGISDANGNVSINWTLGSNIGTQTITVTGFKADGTTPLSGSPLTIFADAQVALEADILQTISGGGQQGFINTILAEPIVVRVLDQFEQPFAGATVFFTPSNGSVSSQTVTTDSNGEAQTTWTLGPTVTDQLLTITAFKADGTTPLSGSPISMFVSSQAPLAIGDFHEGGVVFYLDNTGEHGLVCAITDQSSNATWGCNGTAISGAEGTAIGTGAQNTQDIIAGCTESLIAVEWCSSLSLNGFSDWFLPSKDELNELFANKAVIDATATAFGGTALQTNRYWSSTEINANQAWGYNVFGDDGKNNSYNVRAVRAF